MSDEASKTIITSAAHPPAQDELRREAMTSEPNPEGVIGAQRGEIAQLKRQIIELGGQPGASPNAQAEPSFRARKAAEVWLNAYQPAIFNECYIASLAQLIEREIAAAVAPANPSVEPRDWIYSELKMQLPDMGSVIALTNILAPGLKTLIERERASAVTKLSVELKEYKALLIPIQSTVEGLYAKIASLSPHGTCACSCDGPAHLCEHHSPQLSAKDVEIQALREALQSIQSRFDSEDDGKFLPAEKAGRIAWAMASDARTALAPKSGDSTEVSK